MSRPKTLLRLPYPPSVNVYWRSRIISKGKAPFVSVYMTAKAREYRAAVLDAVGNDREPALCDIALMVTLHPPDKRKRDIDNVLKPLLDSLVTARIYQDDYQVKRLCVEMSDTRKGGAVFVWVERLPALQDNLAPM